MDAAFRASYLELCWFHGAVVYLKKDKGNVKPLRAMLIELTKSSP